MGRFSRTFGIVVARLCPLALGVLLVTCGQPIRADLYKLLTNSPSVPIVSVTGVQITPNPLPYFLANASYQLSAVVTPSNATNKKVTWVSSDETKAKVSATGVVSAVTGTGGAADGETIQITATTQDGGKIATCDVHFSAIEVPVTGLIVADSGAPTVELADSTLTAGDQLNLTAALAPNGANSGTGVTWTTSDPQVVGLSSSTGPAVTITALTPTSGSPPFTSTIRATSTNGFFDEVVIAVTVPVATLTMKAFGGSPLNSLVLAPNGTSQVTVSAAPSTASLKTINWSSNNTSAASVSASSAAAGSAVTITIPGSAVLGSTATITATAADGNGASATCTVTVGNPVTSIVLNPKTAMGLSEVTQLAPAVTPSNGTVQWVSSNTAVATVDATGKVTSHAVGAATVTAHDVTGTVTAPCDVTVYDMNSSSVPLVAKSNGHITGTTGSLSGVTMAVDQSDGTVYIAYVDNTGAGRVLKAAQGATDWTAVGNNFATAPLSISSDRKTNISLAVSEGVPYVAYPDTANGSKSVVAKFTAGNWVPLAAGFVSTKAASYLSLGFDTSSPPNPFLGEVDGFGNGPGAVVYFFQSGSWSNSIAGQPANSLSTASTSDTSVAFDASGTLSALSGAGKDYYVAYNGNLAIASAANFPSIGILTENVGNNFSTAFFIDMVIQNGTMYVASRANSQQGVLYVRKAGSSGSFRFVSSTRADYTTVAVDPRNGTAYVAYADSTQASAFPVIAKLENNDTSGSAIVTATDFPVDALKLAFYVDSTGQGHLYACYGLNGAGGGILVKDFLR